MNAFFRAEVAFARSRIGPAIDYRSNTFVRTNGSTRDNAAALCLDESDQRISIRRKPSLDAGIHELVARRVPAEPHDKLSRTLDFVAALLLHF